MKNKTIYLTHVAISSETHSYPYESLVKTQMQFCESPLYLNKFRFLGGLENHEENENSKDETQNKYIMIYIPLLYSQSVDIKDKKLEISEDYTFNIPDGVDPKMALSILLASFRIYSALFLKAKCLENEKLLILNSGTCWGYLTCQLASSLNCQVIAETNSINHFAFLNKIKSTFKGEKIIQSASENMNEIIQEETLGHGVDCVVDFYHTHSSELQRNVIESLSIGGRWVTIDPNLNLDLPESNCLFLKNASLSFLFDEAYGLYGKELGKIKHIVEEALVMLKEGKLTVFIENEYNSIKQFEETDSNEELFGSSIINIEK